MCFARGALRLRACVSVVRIHRVGLPPDNSTAVQAVQTMLGTVHRQHLKGRGQPPHSRPLSAMAGISHHAAAHHPMYTQLQQQAVAMRPRGRGSGGSSRVASTHAGGASEVVSAAAAAAQASAQTAPAAPAASAAPPAAATHVPGFLGSLSEEQQRAMMAPEQHVRVMAGPGSGKTRVVAARVGWLLQQQCRPTSILVITFTRKAAGELRDRLSADTGAVPHGLSAVTFHTLCSQLLRQFKHLSTRPHWTVANEDDCKSIVDTILYPPEQPSKPDDTAKSSQVSEPLAGTSAEDDSSSAQGSRSSSSRSRSSRSRSSGSEQGSSSGSSKSLKSSASALNSSESSDDGDAENKEEESRAENKEEESRAEQVKYFRSRISAMKNFLESTHSAWKPRRGADIIQELQHNGEPGFTENKLTAEKAAQLACVFDLYQRELRRQKLLDFDDLLHVCLVLVREQPEVRAYLHSRWRHILVDETQDTNLCQFEFVRLITAPDSNLFMVGDPDQAIYGFRGAKSHLMQEKFKQLFPDTGQTYFLADNYRSKPAIIAVADRVRSGGRPDGYAMVRGRSMRKHTGLAVTLRAAYNDWAEGEAIADQLHCWHEEGYSWGDMAVLCRAKRPLKLAYGQADKQGIPVHLQGGDFYDSIEIKTALALLRAVVYPEAASEGLKRRVIMGSAEVKLPLTRGLGDKPLIALAAALDTSASSNSSSANPADAGARSTTSSNSSSSMTLSGCLLSGCGLGSLTPQQAAELWSQWQQASQAHAVGTGERLDALLGLAPEWQPLPGLKRLTKKQQAGINRLRGLVQLAAAAATLQQPVGEVMQLLLRESGMVDKLQQAAAAAVETAGAYDKRRRVQQRLENLEALLDKAARMDASTSLNIMLDDALSESDADTDDRGGFSSSSSSSAAGSGSMITSGEGGSSGSSGSSSSSTPDTSTLLHQFMDYCGLQGDGDDEEGGTGGVREPRVEFMTIHASKGKEFGCVAVMAFNEGVLPSDRAETAEELEQERNTAYVAVTRAKDNLLITWSKVMVRGYYTMQLRPSRYIDNVLFESRRGQMHGVEFEEDEVEEEGFSRSWQ